MLVNSKKILKYALEGKFSNGSLSNCIKELLQNSRRAGAKNVDIQIKNGMLKYKDDGKGVENWIPVITLGDSGWDADVAGVEDPAGFGLFTLYSMANSVEISSGNNKLVFVPAKLIDEEYCNKISEKINKFNKQNVGFYIEAELRDQENINLDNIKETAKYFYMIDKITINNKEIEKIDLNKMKNEAYKVVKFQDNNDIIINKNAIICHTLGDTIPIKIIWHGEVIYPLKINYFAKDEDYVVFVIEKGAPIDVSLPYRQSIIDNNKYRALVKFIENEVKNIVESCIESLKPGIYKTADAHINTDITFEQKIALKYKARNKGKDTAIVDIYDTEDSRYYPSYTYLIYGKHDVKEIEQRISEHGVNKIGFVRYSKKIYDYEEIQYMDNSMVYKISWDKKLTPIGNIIKNIPIIDISHNDICKNKKPYIINKTITSPFFIYYPYNDYLIICHGDLDKIKKTYNEKIKPIDLVDESMKVAFLALRENDEMDSSFYDLSRQLAKRTVLELTREFYSKDKIAEHIINAAAEVIDSPQKLKKLKKIIRDSL